LSSSTSHCCTNRSMQHDLSPEILALIRELSSFALSSVMRAAQACCGAIVSSKRALGSAAVNCTQNCRERSATHLEIWPFVSLKRALYLRDAECAYRCAGCPQHGFLPLAKLEWPPLPRLQQRAPNVVPVQKLER
jgi:hypothetical protein